MQADVWHERWRSGRIGFHQNAVAQGLPKHWPVLNLPEGCPVFVPLCGKSLDMLWLSRCAHRVVGVELSDIAIECFCMENGILARRADLNGFQVYETPDLRLLCGDFFRLTQSDVGSCRAVYDRAALVSWPAESQARYVEHLAELTPSGCQTLLVTVEYPQGETAGPPFSVDGASVHRLYSAHHDIRLLHREDMLAGDSRMRGRGVTQFHEACYQLTRL